ncbi:hydroxymethylglutaryl-CoA lyase [Jeotgalibacillus soli]|uniref:Hydroxymethylglutaryl-CoA lyase n=1 Tax=Jeotgalibacillus soli TaxID=889306 RepID=A0A0C2RR88_9BACL|nr:hydroxymethylglutaryl-CoA lyase [Jeotgalibacillus soli]KIL44274.1 hydroxymethylglutaryl-CoA lyase [Jeotgalibacillus soli]
MHLPKKVTIIEVGPRDGLQNESLFVPTDKKLEFIHQLSASGIKDIEIASFVSPKRVPQMKDANEILKAIPPSLKSIVLTPNKRGIADALTAGAQAVAVFIGVSSSFNQHNINRSTEEAMQELLPIIEELKSKGIFVRACISTAFHCPYEGKIDSLKTLALCKQFVYSGIDELSIADTIGMATPKETYELFTMLKEQLSNGLLTAHFHDTRKMALANIYAALLAGVDRFDSSVGGLGGCPFAPGASGNVATEDVVYMLHEMGIDTGIQLDSLVAAIDIIKPYVSRSFTSGYYTARTNHSSYMS